MKPLRCLLGLHRDQILYEPPGPHTGRYRKGVWCIYCAREWKGPAVNWRWVFEHTVALLVVLALLVLSAADSLDL